MSVLGSRPAARGMPGRSRIEVPGADGVPLLTDHHVPLADGPCPAP
jgi:hypothetical protein